jgi:hypothetical protein
MKAVFFCWNKKRHMPYNKWDLNAGLQNVGTCADVAYQFKSKPGTVKVHITTAGENFTAAITTGKNPMAAQMDCFELEKQLTFIALTG